MLNQTVLRGNLGADPEVFYSFGGHPIASFDLALHSTKKKTGLIRVVCFSRTAQVQYHPALDATMPQCSPSMRQPHPKGLVGLSEAKRFLAPKESSGTPGRWQTSSGAFRKSS